MDELEELSRDAKVALWVAASLPNLREHGYVEGGPICTAEGYAAYQELKRQGFRPTGQEIRDCMRALGARITDAGRWRAAIEERNIKQE